MKFRIEKSFDRDAERIKNKQVLRKLHKLISTIGDADTIRKMPHTRKMEVKDLSTGSKSAIIVWAWKQSRAPRWFS